MLPGLFNARRSATQVLNLLPIISTSFMMYKGLCVVTNSPSPIAVVLSGSMEPSIQRGDLIFLWNRNLFRDISVGDVVVYKVKDEDIPIAHRVIQRFGVGDEMKILTKGDNNAVDDTDLYAKGQDYLERKDIIGSVVAYVPFVGYFTILMSGYPWVKTAFLGMLGFFALSGRV